MTLVFNVLVTSAPKELAGDVGSIRGTTQNLASAVGTAVAGAMLVAILSLNVTAAVINDVNLPDEIIAQVDLDDINTDARLRALKLGLLIMAGISALAILPASRLPAYRPHEIPDPQEPAPR